MLMQQRFVICFDQDRFDCFARIAGGGFGFGGIAVPYLSQAFFFKGYLQKCIYYMVMMMMMMMLQSSASSYGPDEPEGHV
jgi:hypothetical protein